jgi:hypothetical protein
MFSFSLSSWLKAGSKLSVSSRWAGVTGRAGEWWYFVLGTGSDVKTALEQEELLKLGSLPQLSKLAPVQHVSYVYKR